MTRRSTFGLCIVLCLPIGCALPEPSSTRLQQPIVVGTEQDPEPMSVTQTGPRSATDGSEWLVVWSQTQPGATTDIQAALLGLVGGVRRFAAATVPSPTFVNPGVAS